MKVMWLRILVLVCFILGGTSIQAQVPNPFVFPPFNSAQFPADLNGDGRPDLVTGLGTVFLANADGTFTQGVTVSIGTMTCSADNKPCPIPFEVVAVADVTGDGKADMLVQAQQTFLYVLPGNGDGTFGTPVTTNMGLALGQVLIVDVNRDRKADIVTTSLQGANNGQLFVFLGNGDGTFRAGTPFTMFTGSNILRLATGDFNGDGKLDIVASGDTTNTTGPVGILPGNGDGTFGTAITSVGVQAGYIFDAGLGVADFNGDGKLDLVVSGMDPSAVTEQTYFLAGKGDGTFQAPTVVAPGAGTISVADMNGDGKPDAVVFAAPFISVLLGKGNGTFTQKVFANGNPSGAFVAPIADFNGDGKLDVTDGLTVEFGNGDGTLQTVPASLINLTAPFAPALSTVAAGDFNGDGKPDLVVGSGATNPTVYILLGDGAGGYSLAHAYPVPPISGSPASFLAADLNGDKKLDLIFSTGNTTGTGASFQSFAQVMVMLGNGDGTLAPAVSYDIGAKGTTGPAAPSLQLADFNGDGVPDVAAIVDGQLAVALGIGDGSFGPSVSYFGGANANSFALGDFNGDGKADAVVCGSAGIGVLLAHADGTLGGATFPDPPPPASSFGDSSCSVLAAGDFNNDGVSDLIVNQFVPGASTLLGNGDGTFTTVASGATAIGGAVADINGDGKLDLIATDGVTTNLGNGDGTFGAGPSFQPAWINPKVWSNDPENATPPIRAVFAVGDFSGSGLPGIAMIVQAFPGGEFYLPNPLAPLPQDFLLSTSIPGLLAPSGQTSITVTSKPIGGFTGDIALSCVGLPAGVSCDFATGTLTGGSAKTSLTLTASSSAATGRYPFTVTGTSGATSHDQTSAVTIAASAGPTNANLLPTALNFAAQAVGGTTTQTTILTNAGGVPLQISGVSIAGTNAADFSVSSNGCGSSVAAYASCQIVVAFSPKTAGSRSATLAVNDNATGGAQFASLAGGGQDFTVIAGSSGPTATVTAGTSATYSISVGGRNGFGGTVNLSCSGAPTAATCTVSPSSVVVDSRAATTAKVTVTTTARSISVATAGRDDWKWKVPTAPEILAILALTVLLAPLILLLGIWQAHEFKPRRKLARAILATCGFALLAVAGLSGCGGGSGGSTSTGNPTGGQTTGTPAGSYTITVTATTGSGASAVSRTTTLTLVVQ